MISPVYRVSPPPCAFARCLGDDGVACHGIARAVGRDKQVAVRVCFERHDKAEPFGVLAEGADDLARHGGQSHKVAASDDDMPGAAQLFEGRLELRIGIRLHPERPGQLGDLNRGVIGMLKQLDNPVSIHIGHRPLQRKQHPIDLVLDWVLALSCSATELAGYGAGGRTGRSPTADWSADRPSTR